MPSSPSWPGAAKRLLVAAGTETYRSGKFARLEQVPASLQTVVRALAELGFATLTGEPGYLLDPELAELRDAVRAAPGAAPVAVIYYTGHGAMPDRSPFYLLTVGSQEDRLEDTALETRQFLTLVQRREGDHLAEEQPEVLVILDCCYSGAGGMEALKSALEGIGNPRTWIIASAGPLDWAQQGRFAAALADALRTPTTGVSQRYLALESVVQAVNDAFAGEQEARWFTPATGSTGLPPFFPNPAYRPSLAGLTLDEQHWRSRLQAGETEASGFYFTGSTGRVRAAEDLAGWLTRRAGGGLAVVTGSPGAGKSALLALPVFLTEPTRRAELLRDAEPGSLLRWAAGLLPPDLLLIAVHARGLNTDQVAAAVGQGLDRQVGSAAALLEDLQPPGRPAGLPLVIDAVDEASDPIGLLTGLLLPLARRGLSVLVGARRHVLDPVRDAVGLLIDLDTERYRDPGALTRYVQQLLVAAKEPDVRTPYQPAIAGPDRTGSDSSEAAAAAVAAAIAERATARDNGPESFLFARLLALSIRHRPAVVDVDDSRWRTRLAASVGATIEDDLTRRFGERAAVGRVLLAALAWAHGPGLPWENLWVPVARALAVEEAGAGQPHLISDRDVLWLLETAGSYIVEDLGPGGRSVFRPFHDLLAAHLRGEPSYEQTTDDQTETAWRNHRGRTETAITNALLATLPDDRSLRWPHAHPYLRTYLAEHAAGGTETLPALVADPEFLAVADPVTLIPLLTPTDPRLRDIARVYRRAFPLLGGDPRANLAYLQEAAVALHGSALAASSPGIRPLYRTILASVRHDDSLLTLTGHSDLVTSVAFGAGVGGRSLLASGGGDGTVRLWDPATGAPVGEPLTIPGGVGPVAFGTGAGGRSLLASGGGDGTVRLWDPVTGAPVGEPLTGHTSTVQSVAFGTGAGGRPLLASGDWDGTVRLWDPVTGTPVGKPLTRHTREAKLAGHTLVVRSVAFGTGADGRPLLATAADWPSLTAIVRLWDPVTGAPVDKPLTGHYGGVESMALGVGEDGRPLLATGGNYGDVLLWDPSTRAPVERLATYSGGGHVVVAFGAGAGGRPLLATASGFAGEGIVRLWNLTPNAEEGQVFTGHTDAVTSMAFGVGADARPLLATGGQDGTVRLWDPASGAPAGQPEQHGLLDPLVPGERGLGRPRQRLKRAARTSRATEAQRAPRTTRVRDYRPEKGHEVNLVAFGTGVGGRPLLVSAGGYLDETVRLWDPATGVPVRELVTGHPGGVNSVAFGTGAGGRPLLATGGCMLDHTVRLWDPGTGALVGEPLTGHFADFTGGGDSVVFGVGAGGRPLLATASGERGTVRLLDPATGATVRELLTGHTGGVTGYGEGVESVAFGAGAGGRPLLATAGGRGRDGAAVGSGHRRHGGGAADRPHRLGGVGSVRHRGGRAATAGHRRRHEEGPDSAAVGPGHRRLTLDAPTPVSPKLHSHRRSRGRDRRSRRANPGPPRDR